MFCLSANASDSSHSYMRPNTPHIVMTLESSITYGRHFYATSTMRATAVGIVHTFLLNSEITNTDHPACWKILQRMLLFWFEELKGQEQERRE